MSSLTNKNLLLGVTGGIAAYKSADLVRRLRDAGASVRVVMTAAAQAFVTPLTFQALSGHPVHTDLLDENAEAAMGHIELARWADLIVIAPTSADFMAKLAAGEASDLLSTLCLASTAPLLLAPAMNRQMWAAASTQANVSTLRSRGVKMVGPASGSQACGEIGEGRMEEPLQIVGACLECFRSGILAGKQVLITAGPTREAIDPVRYISNHSSGKMGYAVAAACVEAGARTTLVSGPVHLEVPEHVVLHRVNSAREMLETVLSVVSSADIFIGAAAVCDYRPAHAAAQKLKKQGDAGLDLALVQNPDIIAAVAGREAKPFVVGFAAETENLEYHAQDKLQRKNLDMIVANNVSDPKIGFNSDDNAAAVYSGLGVFHYPLQSKAQLARNLITLIAKHTGSVDK